MLLEMVDCRLPMMVRSRSKMGNGRVAMDDGVSRFIAPHLVE